MARLIDADVLMEADLDFDTVDDCVMFRDAIDNAPTVDAVKIVRCKDCKYFKEYTDILTGRKACFCKYKDGHFTVSELHYCSYGERRGENEAD